MGSQSERPFFRRDATTGGEGIGNPRQTRRDLWESADFSSFAVSRCNGESAAQSTRWVPLVARGEVWWTDVGRRPGSDERRCRPVMVVQADEFNRSRIGTVICVLITSDLRYIKAPGNVLAPASVTGLPRDTVINVAQVVTLDRRQLSERAGLATPSLVEQVDAGLLKSLGFRDADMAPSLHPWAEFRNSSAGA